MSWLDTLEDIRKTDWSKVGEPERLTKAREVVNISAYAAAATAVVPVPIADLALLVPVHTAMVMTVGHIYGRKLSGAEAKRVVLELGAVVGLTFAGRAAISALMRFLPGIGGLLSVPATFALTWGVGRVAIEYFKDPKLSREDLKKVFDEAVQEGKAAFSKEAFERFTKGNAGAKAPEEPEPTAPPAPSPEGEGKSEPPSPASPTSPASPPRKKRTL